MKLKRINKQTWCANLYEITRFIFWFIFLIFIISCAFIQTLKHCESDSLVYMKLSVLLLLLPHRTLRYRRQSYLVNHELSQHTDKSLFQCEVCAQRFSTTGSLNRHMMIHTGEKRSSSSKHSFIYSINILLFLIMLVLSKNNSILFY